LLAGNRITPLSVNSSANIAGSPNRFFVPVRCQIDALLARAGIDYQNPQPTAERTDPIVPGPNGETLADIRAMLKGKGIDYPLHPDETVAGGDEQDSGSPIDASPPSGNGGT